MSTVQPECGAIPLAGMPHDGPVAAYVRICPAGHLRSGYACGSCAGNGAVMCIDCDSDGPAILIPAATWDLLTVRELNLDAAASAVGAAMVTRSSSRAIALAALQAAGATLGQPEKVLTAEGAGPLLDPDCRDGKCGSCIGPPCEHECHKR